MGFLSKFSALFLSVASMSFASSATFYLSTYTMGGNCVSSADESLKECYNASGSKSKPLGFPSVRFRVINPRKLVGSQFGIMMERPFFVIDGIDLNTDEARTLNQFEREADAFGIPNMLSALGYTPILVQFSETVRTSLKSNSKNFAALLRYLNDSKLIPFPNKMEDGFVVMGISQGGILGRYGSYLYDKDKEPGSAPVRLFASIDSPHQGAVMPRSLISTIDFWAHEGDNSAASAFLDMISGAGASELLIYESDSNSVNHDVNTSSNRFLFGDYRKAAEYKGFPTVLVAQGQLKGTDTPHKSKYFELSRKVSLSGKTLGRAESSMGISTSDKGEYAYNRMYVMSADTRKTSTGKTPLDFIQGSTYPFAQRMYESLREGMEDAISYETSEGLGLLVAGLPVKVSSKWDADSLYQASSTFIPTASAMDIKCNGDLAIRGNCAHSLTSSQVSFEKPGQQSSATSVYAVDPTHPRYNESVSGRHIESPYKGNSIDNKVLSGMQTDLWRVLCEVAKHDYNPQTGRFRNSKLNGYFSPSASCMDRSKMPEIVKNGGVVQFKKMSYVRYDFNASATEKDSYATFKLPAGWQRVAIYDNGRDVPTGSALEVKIRVRNRKSNWMKAELLLTKEKHGGAQIQLSEASVTQNGLWQTIRWQIPGTAEILKNYRWFRLVLNSNGADVDVSQPTLITNTQYLEEVPETIKSSAIYPNNSYNVTLWSNDVSIKEQTVGTSNVLVSKTAHQFDGFHLNFRKSYSMDKYSELVVTYVPGTCQNTAIYFGAKGASVANLASDITQNSFVVKTLPLSQIVDTKVTPKNSLSASRLSVQAMKDNETCKIKDIYLK